MLRFNHEPIQELNKEVTKREERNWVLIRFSSAVQIVPYRVTRPEDHFADCVQQPVRGVRSDFDCSFKERLPI